MPLRRLCAVITPAALLVVTCLLGGWFKLQCGAWHDAIQYTTGCYSDAVPFWGLRGVAAGQLPYLEARLEYPVLTGALIWVEGLITRLALGAQASERHFLTVVIIVNALLALQVLAMMERAGVARWRLYGWAAAPPLVLYIGHNWDMLAVALAVAAFLAAHRGADVRAAVLAALGTAAKLFPVLLLPLLGLGVLARRRVAQAAALTAAAIAAWAAVNLPVASLAWERWSEFYTFSRMRPGTAAAVWEIMAAHGWWYSDLAARNLWSFVTFATGASAIVALGWRRHGGRPWLLFTPVLAWFLLTSKVWSPQFDLWLYPFLLLTCRRWWLIGWFAAADIACYFAEFWWFAAMDGHGPGATPDHIAIAAGLRAAAMLWIIVDGMFARAPFWVAGRTVLARGR